MDTFTKDLLLKNKLEVQRIIGESLSVVEDAILKASVYVAPKSVKALELWERSQERRCYLPTSLDLLDDVLHGGLPVGTITEVLDPALLAVGVSRIPPLSCPSLLQVAGPSGCGKTQFSMLMSVVSCVRPAGGGEGGRGAVIYIDTESAFSAERLIEVAENRYPEEFRSEESLLDLTSRVHIYTESTCKGLQYRLENLEEDIIELDVKLIVLDSVASLIRKEFDSRAGSNMVERTKLLGKQAALLKYIAETFHIPVLVTNQITTRYGGHHSEASSVSKPSQQPASDDKGVDDDGGYVTAALGNTWSHCVNTRLIVQYLDGARRQILVAKSPIAPFATFVYTIQASGLQLERGGADHYEGTDPGLQNIRVRTSLPHRAFQY